MERIYTSKQEARIKVNLLFASIKRPCMVNIIDCCEKCYFLEKKKGRHYCRAWGNDNPRYIKYPKGNIDAEHCVLFEYKSETPSKGKLMGKVYSKI